MLRLFTLWKPSSTHTARLAFVPFAIGMLLGSIGLIASLIIASTVRPHVSEHLVSTMEGKWEPFEPPYYLNDAPVVSHKLQFTLTLSRLFPTWYVFSTDDCLDALFINDHPLLIPQLPFCDYQQSITLRLSPYLQAGPNRIVAHIRNHGGPMGMQFYPWRWDPILIIPTIVLPLMLLVLSFVFIFYRFHLPRLSLLSLSIVLLPVLLRIHYVLQTPHWIRGHDTDGHIEYMDYLHQHAALPPPHEGWEFWQPPLYYVFGALWLRTADLLSLSRVEALRGLQYGSLLISLILLMVIWRIGKQLFPLSKGQSTHRLLFFSLVAFMPGIVFLSARINNDTLVTLLSFLAFSFLLSWWHAPRPYVWFTSITIIAVGMLTKSTIIILIPVAFSMLLLHRHVQWRHKLRDGLLGLFLLLTIAGWHPILRAQQASNDPLVGNIQSLNSNLGIPNAPSAFLVFNPLRMIPVPFNDPWNDLARRQYFWEYFYRSAFFGEFNFGDPLRLLASSLLTVSFFVFLLALVGGITLLRTSFYQHLPLYLLGCCTLVAHLVFRLRYPFSSSQDIRYSLLLFLPLATFAIHGAFLTTTPAIRRLLLGLAIAFVMLMGVFQVSI